MAQPGSVPKDLCERWSHENVVLLAMRRQRRVFNWIGTKLALESAVALADYLHKEDDRDIAFQRYEDERRLEVLKLQSAARNSMEWFERVELYLDDPVQLNYSMLTRSQRSVTKTCASEIKTGSKVERWFMRQAGVQTNTPARTHVYAFETWGSHIKNRVVVSPMAQYKSKDGCVNDWHLVHYGERAKGGGADFH